MTQTSRLFVAITLPETHQAIVGKSIGPLHQTIPRNLVRWVPEQNLHLTLKFLGDTAESRIPKIQEALEDAVRSFQPFNTMIGRVGCFPNSKKPRVLWLSLDQQAQELQRLQKEVEYALGHLGFPHEKRPFSPHLTIGRVKRHVQQTQLAAIGDAVARSDIVNVANWQCDTVHLMKSRLSPQGAMYTSLSEHRLRTSN